MEIKQIGRLDDGTTFQEGDILEITTRDGYTRTGKFRYFNNSIWTWGKKKMIIDFGYYNDSENSDNGEDVNIDNIISLKVLKPRTEKIRGG